jgi:RNA polymerase sigma-70 factor (ECF subfamily)
MDEAALINDAKNGDLDAFNRLVLAYQDILFNQAYRIFGDPAAADDATQEAFISAYKKLHTYRGGSFKAWLLRIVTNACYDELRKNKRRPTTPLIPTDDYDEEIDSPRWMIDPGAGPEEIAEIEDLSQAIQNCLDELSADFKTVVILVDIQGMNYDEAAEVISSPLGTVKSRLARARNGMRECLQQFWELLPPSFRLINEV